MIQRKKASDGVGHLNARAERAQWRNVVSAAARRIVERLESRTMLSAVSEDALPAPYLPPQHDLVNLNGFLSGSSAGNALQIAQDYLHAHAASLGVSVADLDSASVTDQYTDTDTGITHIYMRQTLNDLPVANANLVINLTRDGRVLNVAGGFVPGLGESQAAMGGAMLEAGVSVTQVGRYLSGFLATAHKNGAKMDAASRVEPGTSLYIEFADQMNTRLRRVGDGRETVEPWRQLRTGARLGSDYRPLAVASVNVGELTRRLFADASLRAR